MGAKPLTTVEVLSRAIIEASPDIILLTDEDGRVEFANRPAAGYGASEVIGRPLFDFFRPGDLPTVTAAIRKATTGGAVEEFIAGSKNRDGTSSVYVTRVRAVGEGVADRRLVFYISDRTEEVQAKSQLEHAQNELEQARAQFVQAQKLESLGRLAGGVAHDFNNLLTTIISFTRFVMDELPPEDPRRQDLSEVMKAADSAARLTGKLLSFAKRKPIEPTVFDVAEAVTNFDKLLRRTVGGSVELIVLVPEKPVLVRFDIGQLEQLLMNLVINARDAMPNGGKLTIRIGEKMVRGSAVLMDGLYSAIAVTDTGVGIDPQVVDRIFEPFFTTKGERGTGLGLSTCYGIARQADGDLVVESETGKGTTMTVLLPRAQPTESETVTSMISSVPIASLAPGRFGRVLVVEDQPAILRMMKRCFERAGYEVLQARTAEEALTLFDEASNTLRFVVSDVVLPGLSGVELVRRVRERVPDTCVILTSGYMGDEAPAGVETNDHTAFLAKPFTADQLLAHVERLQTLAANARG